MLQLACNRNNATQHFQVRLSQFYQQQTLDLSLHKGIETYKWQPLLRAMTEARLSHRLNVYSALTHNPCLMINSEDCQEMHTLNDTNTKHRFLCAFRVLCMTSQKGKREVGRLSWQKMPGWWTGLWGIILWVCSYSNSSTVELWLYLSFRSCRIFIKLREKFLHDRVSKRTTSDIS